MFKRSHSLEGASRSTATPHPLGAYAHSVRTKIFVAIFSLASLDGCAMISGIFGSGKTPQQKASEAYSEGNLKGALGYYQNLDPKSLSEADKLKMKEISDAIESVANFYLAKAREATANRMIQRNNYLQAIGFYREARSLLPPNHASRKVIEDELLKIENSLKEFEKQYKDTQTELDKALALPTLTVESIDQLYNLFYKMQILRAALQKGDKTLYDKAIGKAKRLLSDGDIVGAYELCKIAQAVDFNEGEIVRTTQVTQGDMTLFATVKVKKDGEIARRKAEAERLSQLAFVAFGERKMEEVRRLIDEVRKLETKEFKAANQLASKINTMSRSRQGSPAPKKPMVAAVASVPPVAEVQPATPPQEEAGDLEQVRLSLDNLVSQFKAGDKFEAFAGLEEAMAEFSASSNLAFLSKQRNAWDLERKNMISQIREKADKLFVEEDPEALGAYKSLLRLNPPDDLRRQAVERIKTLENILGK